MKLDDVIERLEKLKRTTKTGVNFWFGRDIQDVLGYANWQNFERVIDKGKMSCESAGMNTHNHFIDISKVMKGGHGAQLKISDFLLSRYACYLIAMNGDPGKQEIGIAQSYFAYQTRKQEIRLQKTNSIAEMERRKYLRQRVKSANRNLNSAAKKAGVKKYGIFHDAGYRGLYGGLSLKEIKQLKGILETDDFLDRIGRAELAANEFRITQAEEKLVRDSVYGEENAIQTHRKVGVAVRRTIEKLQGTMPEKLPAYESLKTLELKHRKALRARNSRNPN